LANTEHPDTTMTSKKIEKVIFFIEISRPATTLPADLLSLLTVLASMRQTKT
jgi:hypothetical protein